MARSCTSTISHLRMIHPSPLGSQLSLTIDGLTTRYYRLGHGPYLLFLHGGQVQASTFHKTLMLLSQHYTVIAPDIPGYGQSDTPAHTWTFIDYGHFFSQFLDQLKVTQPTIIGYSMGGGIAASLASQHPVQRLILINASGIPVKRISQFHKNLQRLVFYALRPSYWQVALKLGADYAQFILKHKHSFGHIQAIRTACLSRDYSHQFRHITCPTTLIWSTNDQIYPLTVARQYQTLISQAQLVTVSGNHDWLVYDPLQIKTIML